MLKFVSHASKIGRFAEAHVLDTTNAGYHRMKSQGRYGRLGVTAPPALPQDHVMDCELLFLFLFCR